MHFLISKDAAKLPIPLSGRFGQENWLCQLLCQATVSTTSPLEGRSLLSYQDKASTPRSITLILLPQSPRGPGRAPGDLSAAITDDTPQVGSDHVVHIATAGMLMSSTVGLGYYVIRSWSTRPDILPQTLNSHSRRLCPKFPWAQMKQSYQITSA